MAALILSADTNIDAITRAAGDTINTNGFNLTIDQDTRYGTNAGTGLTHSTLTVHGTKGGNIEVDARYVRLIPYDTGTGNVPAYNTTISQGSASGKMIGVISALNATPTAVGAAMPVSGYIKVKAWNSVAYAAGALTGIGATATGADVVGFIELVGDEAAQVVCNRLGVFRMRGEWFDLGTTSGSNATTYQAPTNGSIQYYPMIEVETGTGTGVYEVYVCAGSRTALASNVATDSIRGKVFWASTGGVIRFQHDGTNSTGGYLPPSGRNIRMPNIITANCTTAARTANVLPNATLTTRYEIYTNGGGQVSIDKALVNWWPDLLQAYSVNITHSGVLTQLFLQEVASTTTLSFVGVGQEAANAQFGLSMSLCFAGGTISDCVFSTATLASANRYAARILDVSGFTFTSNKLLSFVNRANATTGSALNSRVANSTFTSNTFIGGRIAVAQCKNVTYNNTVYIDALAGTTVTANPMNAFDISTASANITIDGITFGGLTLVQPYAGLVAVSQSACANIKVRNIGTPASPLNLGGDRLDAKGWTQATTTATVTSVAHGLKANDIIYVIISSNTSIITVGSKTVTAVPTADTFTFTCLTGALTGTLSYYPTMTSVAVSLAAGSAANTVKFQRIYTINTRGNLITSDNSAKDVLVENCWGALPLAATGPILNGTLKGLGNSFNAGTAQTATYGTHWYDSHNTGTPANIAGVAWTRATTTATITSTDHGLRTGDFIDVDVSDSTAAIVLGQKTITATTKDEFRFTCLNAGAASGVLTFSPSNSRIGLVMNEATTESASQYTIDSGTPSFTSAGGLYMPTVGQQVTFEVPYYILGHTGFQKVVPTMTGGTIANYSITYAIDKNDGSGYSSFKNAYYPRGGGGGSNASTTVTMTSTTGVAVDDYITGTNLGVRTRVVSIDSSTNITVSVANIGTVSGTLIFFQHPNEGSLTSAGMKLKVRILTSITNTTAITSLSFLTTSTSTTRAYQYDLDPVVVTFNVKDAADNTNIVGARVYITADTGGPAVFGTVIANQVTDANGNISVTYPYVGSQPITGRVRKSTASPLYKTSPLSGTISSTGYSGTVFMVKDE